MFHTKLLLLSLLEDLRNEKVILALFLVLVQGPAKHDLNQEDVVESSCWRLQTGLNVFWTIHCESGESASSVAVISTTALNVGWDDFLRLVMLSNPSSAFLVSPAGEARCWWTMASPSSPLCCSPSARRPNRTRCSSSAVSSLGWTLVSVCYLRRLRLRQPSPWTELLNMWWRCTHLL